MGLIQIALIVLATVALLMQFWYILEEEDKKVRLLRITTAMWIFISLVGQFRICK